MRFSEFSGEYKKTNLNSIVTKIKRKAKESSNASIRMISYGNGFILQDEKYGKDNAGSSLKNYTLLKKGEFAYNHGASKNKPYGVCYRLKEDDEARVPFVYHCFSIDTSNNYWEYALNTKSNDKQLKKLVSSGARMDGLLNISFEAYGSILINVPSSKEQEKIAIFLNLIDERIETQSKIIEDLNILIKGIRHIIFSNNYNYKVFNEIELCYLKDFLTEYSQKNLDNNLQSASIGKYGIRIRDEIYSKKLSNDYSSNKIIFKDTLSIGMGSTQIDIGILSDDKKYCISPAYTTYLIKNINSKYLNEYLIYLNPLLSKRYMVIGARQGKSVNKLELLNHNIWIHSKQEQQKIVKIFASLYNKLSKEKDMLLLYNKQKAYLLQNMFI